MRAKMTRVVLIILALVMLTSPIVFLLQSCGGPAPTTAATTAASSSAAGTTGATAGDTTARSFTAAELAGFDGKNGSKAYIAVDGIVYDVTAVSEWASRLHAGRFAPGKDYSAEIKKAPHGVDKLLKAIKVGTYAG